MALDTCKMASKIKALDMNPPKKNNLNLQTPYDRGKELTL